MVHRMVKRAVEMEGTVTGEHGVGIIKRDYLEHEVGKSTVDGMRKVSLILPPSLLYYRNLGYGLMFAALQLKQAFDPLSLLNPDKVVRVEIPNQEEVKQW